MSIDSSFLNIVLSLLPHMSQIKRNDVSLRMYDILDFLKFLYLFS